MNQSFVRRVVLCTMVLAAIVAAQSWLLADDDQVTLTAESATLIVTKKPERGPEPLYIINADGTKLRKLVQLSDQECSGSPVWTRDGKHILFDAWRCKDHYSTSHIYKVSVDGSWPTDLGPGAMPDASPHNPSLIVYHYYGSKQGVWLGTGVKNAVRVIDDGGSPRWHPFEKKIAYIQWGGGIATRTISGNEFGDEKIIVPAKYRPYIGYCWAPDGKSIVFYSYPSQGKKAEIMVLNVAKEGSEPKVIATGRLGYILSWSPDGTKIAYDDYSEETKTRQIFIVDPSSSAPAYRLPGQEADQDNGGPMWSPSGKQLVFTRIEHVAPKK